MEQLASGQADLQAQAAELLLGLGAEEARALWQRARPAQRQGRQDAAWLATVAGLCAHLRDDEAALSLSAWLLADADLDELALFWMALRARLPADAFFDAVGRPRQPLPLDLRPVPGGLSVMGDGARQESDEWPEHLVSLPPFHITATPVTRAQWARFAPGAAPPSDLPAGEMSWLAAWLFAEWAGCALPTEAQWERACRAGTETRFWWGDHPDPLPQVAWHRANAGSQPHPVGQLDANPLGLHDLLGNVMEWCADPPRVYTPGRANQPGEDAQAAPPSVRTSLIRPVRGGFYDSPAEHCLAAARCSRSSPASPASGCGW